MFAGDMILFRFPFHAERRIGGHVVKMFVRVAVAVALAFLGAAGSQGIAEDHVVDVFALDHQVGTANGEGFRVVFLSEQFDVGLVVFFQNSVFRFRENTAGAAGGIVDFDDFSGFIDVFFTGEKQLDHQLDDFAGREMIPGFFVGLFVETPDQILENVAHRDIGNTLGMKIDIGDRFDDFVQAIRFIQLVDFFFEFEFFQDVARPRRESGYEILQVRIDMIGVGQNGLQRQTAFVEKAEPGFLKHNFFDTLVAHALVDGLGVISLFESFIQGGDFILAVFQHAVQAP